MVVTINYNETEVIKKMVFIIEQLVDLALAISEYISQAVQTIINCFLYPFQCIFTWIKNIITLIIDSFTSLISTIWNTFDIIYDYIYNLLTLLFPNIWVTLILLGVTIVFLLRIYYFLKDIHILGTSI